MSVFSLNFFTSAVDEDVPLFYNVSSSGGVVRTITKGFVVRLQLKSLVFLKEVYHHCFVRAIISVAFGKNGRPSIEQLPLLSRYWISNSVEILKYVKNNDGSSLSVSIGSNFFVYRVRPLVSLDNQKLPSKCDIELQIFSRDKLLSIDAFSRSYVSQRLAADIIARQTCSNVVTKKVKIDGKEVTKTSYFPPAKGALPLASSYNVPFITAKLEHTFGLCRNENNSKPWYLEYRQPYLVQYNEPFYAFISRVANRCGEMLYFERGTLVLGRSSAVPIAISQSAIEALDFRNQPLDTPLPPDVNCDFYYNYNKKISSSHYSQTTDIKVEISKKQHSHCGNVEVDVKTYVDSDIVYSWSTNDKKQPAWVSKLSIVPSSNPHHRIISFDVDENKVSERSVTLSLSGKYDDNGTPKQELLCTITLKQTTNDNDPAPADTISPNQSVSKSQLPFVIDYAVDDSVDIIPQRKFSHPSSTSSLSTVFNTFLTSFFNNQTPISYRTNVQNFLTSAIQETLLSYSSLLASAQHSVNKLNKDFYDSRSSMVENYNSTEQDFSDSNGSKFSSPFATVLTDDAVNVSANLFSLVSRRALQSARRMVRVFLRPSASSLVAVGDAVTLPGDTNTYVVTRVRGSYLPDKSGKNYIEKYYFDAAPLSDVDNTFYPPIYPCSATKPMAPSVAFVDKANTDPQGPSGTARVRVRYPWDPDDSKPSPWLRMLTPMAPKGGGFYFKPEEKDEVILHYVAGNPERPFVAGSFFNASAHKDGFSRYISNPTGQYIAFGATDPFLFSTITGHIPYLNFVFSLVPPSFKKVFQPIKSDDYKQLSGKLDMGDKFGIWSISCNSAKRSVSIDSCYGSVSFSAFTGISIAAHRGNVNIIGRDIRFFAANNVKFSSGLNISAKKSFDDNFNLKKSAINVPLGVFFSTVIVYSTNMTLIRTIWETFIMPSEGSTVFHSARFLALEAGNGKVINDATSFIKDKSNKSLKRYLYIVDNFHKVAASVNAIFEKEGFYREAMSKYIVMKNIVNEEQFEGVGEVLKKKQTELEQKQIPNNNIKNECEREDEELSRIFNNKSDEGMKEIPEQNRYNAKETLDSLISSKSNIDDSKKEMGLILKENFENLNKSPILNVKDENLEYLQVEHGDKLNESIENLFGENGIIKHTLEPKDITLPLCRAFQEPSNRKLSKRFVFYHFVKSIQSFTAAEIDGSNDLSAFNDDVSWCEWVRSIKLSYKPKKPAIKDVIKTQSLRFWTSHDDYNNDAYVWDKDSAGSILISDDISRTIRLDATNTQPTVTYNHVIESIIDFLLTI